MIVFERLEISSDGKQILIDAHVNKAEYYKDIRMRNLFIILGESYLESNYTVSESNAVYIKALEDVEEVHLVINLNETTAKSFSTDLVYVIIEATGLVNGCAPCRADENFNVGVTFDTGLLYNEGLKYIKELGNSCNIPQGFTDFVLNWEALKLAIESEHYKDASKIFNRLFTRKNNSSSAIGCGCNGRLST